MQMGKQSHSEKPVASSMAPKLIQEKVSAAVCLSFSDIPLTERGRDSQWTGTFSLITMIHIVSHKINTFK